MANKVKPVRVKRTIYSTKNQTDTTLRNNRARQKEIAELTHRLRETNDRIVNLRAAVGEAFVWFAGGNVTKEQLELLLDKLSKV